MEKKKMIISLSVLVLLSLIFLIGYVWYINSSNVPGDSFSSSLNDINALERKSDTAAIDDLKFLATSVNTSDDFTTTVVDSNIFNYSFSEYGDYEELVIEGYELLGLYSFQSNVSINLRGVFEPNDYFTDYVTTNMIQYSFEDIYRFGVVISFFGTPEGAAAWLSSNVEQYDKSSSYTLETELKEDVLIYTITSTDTGWETFSWVSGRYSIQITYRDGPVESEENPYALKDKYFEKFNDCV